MSSDRDSKVIGYFAYASPVEVVCTDTACVIAGSDAAMRAFLAELHPTGAAGHTIRKTRFAEILSGMRHGAAYAFDAEAYGRFLPLGREAGVPAVEVDFAAAHERGNRFIKIAALWRIARRWRRTAARPLRSR
jgi:hypothetical protein